MMRHSEIFFIVLIRSLSQKNGELAYITHQLTVFIIYSYQSVYSMVQLYTVIHNYIILQGNGQIEWLNEEISYMGHCWTNYAKKWWVSMIKSLYHYKFD